MVKQSIAKLIGLPVKCSGCAGIMLFVVMALVVQRAEAQVVPYRVEGTGFGSLLDLTSFGEANGRHLGRSVFTADVTGVTTLVAADGSLLRLKRKKIVFLDTTDPDPETGLVVTTLIEEVAIQDGTDRFIKVQPAGGNLTTFVESEPYDPLGDLTAIPFYFETVGQMDLGRRR